MSKLNDNEKHSANMIIWIASIEGFIMGLINIFSKDEYKTEISIGVFIAILGLLFLFKESLFSWLVKHVSPSKNKRKIYAGKWLLDISFKDDRDKKQGRSGTCNIEHSILGVKIYGDKLIDKKDRSITRKDLWISDSAEIIQQNNNEILVYLYKIPSDATHNNNYDEMSFNKVGIVVAYKKGEDDDNIMYSGTFRDIPLDDNQEIREGSVILTPTKA